MGAIISGMRVRNQRHFVTECGGTTHGTIDTKIRWQVSTDDQMLDFHFIKLGFEFCVVEGIRRGFSHETVEWVTR